MSDLYKARFEENVSPEPMSGCWLWTGIAWKDGRARFFIKNKIVSAARVSWILYKNHIESITPNVPDWYRYTEVESRLVLHTCDNQNCVNPDHLYIGTHKQNAIDRCARHPYFVNRKEKKFKKTIDAV